MTSIAKGFILGVTTPAKRKTRIFTNQLTTGSDDPHMTSNIQWTIEPGIDRCFLLLWLLWTPIEPFEVQRAGWTGHDHLSDSIC